MRFSAQLSCAVATFLCVYIVAYCALLQPVVYVDASAGGIANGHKEAGYRVGGAFCRIIFAPLAWVDRSARPRFWTDIDS